MPIPRSFLLIFFAKPPIYYFRNPHNLPLTNPVPPPGSALSVEAPDLNLRLLEVDETLIRAKQREKRNGSPKLLDESLIHLALATVSVLAGDGGEHTLV